MVHAGNTPRKGSPSETEDSHEADWNEPCPPGDMESPSWHNIDVNNACTRVGGRTHVRTVFLPRAIPTRMNLLGSLCPDSIQNRRNDTYYSGVDACKTRRDHILAPLPVQSS